MLELRIAARVDIFRGNIVFEHPFSVCEQPFLFLNILVLFSNGLSCYRMNYSDLERANYFDLYALIFYPPKSNSKSILILI